MSASRSRKFQEVFVTDTPKPVSFEIDWTIPNFFFFKAHTEKIKSKTRIIGRSSWHLELHPLKKAGQNEATYDSVALYVCHQILEKGTNFTILAQIKLGVADKSHSFVEGKTTSVKYTFTNSGTSYGYGTHTFVAHSDLFDPDATLLVDDGLIVRVEVKYASLDALPPDESSENVELPQAADDFKQSFRYLYDMKIGQDFVLVSSDGIKIPVHRAVLISRSPVFSAMFDNDMTESRTGRCGISDVDGDTLAIVVKYMYCGCSESELEQHTEKILLAADKYQLKALVNQCEQLLIRSLSKENLVDLLVLSEQTNTLALKDAVEEYIRVSAKKEEFRGSGMKKEIFEKASAEFAEEIVQRLTDTI